MVWSGVHVQAEWIFLRRVISQDESFLSSSRFCAKIWSEAFGDLSVTTIVRFPDPCEVVFNGGRVDIISLIWLGKSLNHARTSIWKWNPQRAGSK